MRCSWFNVGACVVTVSLGDVLWVSKYVCTYTFGAIVP